MIKRFKTFQNDNNIAEIFNKIKANFNKTQLTYDEENYYHYTHDGIELVAFHNEDILSSYDIYLNIDGKFVDQKVSKRLAKEIWTFFNDNFK